MGDSVSDIIFIVVFGFLVFFLNMRKKKKGKLSREDLPLEKRGALAHSDEIIVHGKNDIERPEKKNIASEDETLKKHLISDQNNYKGKRISEKALPFEPKSSSSADIHAALIDSPVFSKEASLSKDLDVKPRPSNLGEIAEKARSKDMVILSAIYFTPYI